MEDLEAVVSAPGVPGLKNHMESALFFCRAEAGQKPWKGSLR